MQAAQKADEQRVFGVKKGVDYSPLHHYHREAGKPCIALGTRQSHQALTLGKIHMSSKYTYASLSETEKKVDGWINSPVHTSTNLEMLNQ